MFNLACANLTPAAWPNRTYRYVLFSSFSRFVSVVSCLLILLTVVLADVGFSTVIFFHNMKTGPAQPCTSMRRAL